MPGLLPSVLICEEHERLEFELLEVRTRAQYLTRLRSLSPQECAAWDRKERQALADRSRSGAWLQPLKAYRK